MQSSEGSAILRELGAGGGSRTFLCQFPQMSQPVVVKTLANSSLPQPGIVEEAQRTILHWSSLEQAGVVIPLRVGLASGRIRWMLPYYSAGSLEDRIRIGATSSLNLSQMSSQLSHALGQAHERGLVHGNLKPTNVLFDEEGQVLVTDFQLWTSAGARRGSPELEGEEPDYRAPEVRAGGVPTPASDQYALALILLTILTREPPRRAYAQLLTAQAIGNVPAARAIPKVSQFHSRLLETFRRALSDRPEDRFPSVLAFDRAFQQSMGFAPEPKPQPQPAVRSAPQVSRRRRFSLLAPLLAMTLCLAITVPALSSNWVEAWFLGGGSLNDDLQPAATSPFAHRADPGLEEAPGALPGEAEVDGAIGEDLSSLPLTSGDQQDGAPEEAAGGPSGREPELPQAPTFSPSAVSSQAPPVSTSLPQNTQPAPEGPTPAPTLAPTSTPISQPVINPNSCKTDPNHPRYCTPTPGP